MLTHLFMKAKVFLGSIGAAKEEGQGLIEYALIVLLIAIAVLVVLGLLGDQVNNVFNQIVTGLGG